jgi:hypothetical protein
LLVSFDEKLAKTTAITKIIGINIIFLFNELDANFCYKNKFQVK